MKTGLLKDKQIAQPHVFWNLNWIFVVFLCFLCGIIFLFPVISSAGHLGKRGAPASSFQLGQEDLKNIVRGACFLGSGGGGSYEVGMQLVKKFPGDAYYKGIKGGRIDVISVEDLRWCRQ